MSVYGKPEAQDYSNTGNPKDYARYLRACADSARYKCDALIEAVRTIEAEIRQREIAREIILERIAEFNIFANETSEKAKEFEK